MPVAIDSSVLIELERSGGLSGLLLTEHSGPFYIPAHTAAEFLAGAHMTQKKELRERALKLYSKLSHLFEDFEEPDAMALAQLNADLRREGQRMGFFDAAIAASCISRNTPVLTLDSDYDRLNDRLEVLKYTPNKASA